MNAKITAVALALSTALSACASSGAPAVEERGAVPPSEEAGRAEGAALPEAPTVTEAPASAASATFSGVQADRGRDTFRAKCTECHYSGEFSDPRFQRRWAGRTAGSLYETIQQYMPETDPGSLRPEEAVDLLAYILRMNGFQPGAGDLVADRAILDRISLARIRGG